MVKKFTIITIILLLIQIMRLIINGILLIWILLFDIFLLIDIITVVAEVLLSISIIGIIIKNKLGAEFAIINAVFDIILNFIFYNISFILALILNLIIIVFAYKELKHVNLYNQSISQPATSQAIST